MKYRLRFFGYRYAVRGLQYVIGYVMTVLIAALLNGFDLVTLGPNTFGALALGGFIAWNALVLLLIPLRLNRGRGWGIGPTSIAAGIPLGIFLWQLVSFLYPSGWKEVPFDWRVFGAGLVSLLFYVKAAESSKIPLADYIIVLTAEREEKHINGKVFQSYMQEGTEEKKIENHHGDPLTFNEALGSLGLRRVRITPYMSKWVDKQGNKVLEVP